MNEPLPTPPTSEDIMAARKVLAQLTPGALPLDIFIEVARLTTTPILEVVPLRRNESGEVEVLLTERDQDDPIWGGLLHTPGTVIRASDNAPNNAEAFSRILDAELSDTRTGDPQFVYNIFHKVKRGAEQAQVYYVKVLGEANNGQFYSSVDLPSNVVDTQLDFIKRAVKAFETAENPQP